MKVTIKRLTMKFPGESCAVLLTAHNTTIRAKEPVEIQRLVGTVVLKDFQAGGCAEFSRLFVDDKFRHAGVGRALMAEVYRIAKEGKASGVSGYVKPNNLVALAFYKKEGFMPVWNFSDGDHLLWRPL